MMEKRTTIRDIARELGVSKSTVSAALAGDPRVKRSTRERVERAAEEMGYRPHPHFRILGSQRRRSPGEKGETIAFLMQSRDVLRKPRYEASMARAAALGYEPEIWEIDCHSDSSELARVLYHRGIRVLVLVAGCEFDPGPDFPWERFAVVASGHHTGPAPVDAIEHDTYAGVRIAWERVREAGWRRIGAYLPYELPRPTLRDEKRVAAFEYLRGRDLPVRDHVPALQVAFQDTRAFQDWFREHRPDAIIGITAAPFTNPDFLPAGSEAPPWVNLQLGLNPKGCAGIRWHQVRAHEMAVEWLDEKLRLGQFGLSEPAKRMVLEPEWLDGPSLPTRLE